ncbi:MAG: CAP domain-containing protein [Chloroflexota bacterium]
MKNLLRVCLLLFLALAPLGLTLATASAEAAPDFDVADGHFFSQTAKADGATGYTVVDDGEARFWSEFQRLGGVQGVGYPLSQRFRWDGFVVQVMQKGVLQWRPEVGRAYFVNIFDQLATAGKNDWLLSHRATPAPLDATTFDAGKNWQQTVEGRVALLDANAAIKARYNAVADPINLYGLPTSRVVDNGNHYVIRLQRAVIQQWKEAVPWAAAGQVTVANGGEVGMEAGLFPAAALQAVPAPRAQAPSRGGDRPTAPPATAPGTPQQAALELVNHYRALAGAAPLTLDPRVQQAAQAHANYYVLNYGDPKLAGMGLHVETPGKPGFTGASMGDRAKAAGYTGYSMDENFGLVGDAKRMIEWCMDTVNHRWNMIHPSAVHLGYGIASKPPVDVMNIGFSGERPTVALPTTYPGAGQTGVPTSAMVYETPDPAPGVARPLGYPITISFHVRDNVQYTSWSLVDAEGQAAQLYTTQKSWIKSLALIPARPLRAASKYTATVSGTVNGQPFSKTWSFTTR